MKYTISYDIPDTKRRTKLSKLLLNYGDRVQFSIFEAELTESLYSEMLCRIIKLLDEKADKLTVHRLCRACTAARVDLGLANPPLRKDVYII